MRNVSRLLALLVALCLVLAMPMGFAEEGTETEDVVLATIGETEVLQSEVDEIYDEIVSYYSQYGIDVTSEDMVSAIRQMAMETWLQTAFYDAEAKALGLDPLSEEDGLALLEQIDTTYEDLISQVYTYYGLEPAEDASDEDKASARETAIVMLDAMGYTYDYIAVTERRNFLYEKVNEQLTSELTVSEDDIVAEYNEHVASDEETYKDDPSTYEIYTAYYGYEPYYVPEGFRGITHILLDVDDDLLATYQDLQNRFEEQAEPSEDADGAETAETEGDAEAAEPVTEEQVEAAKAAIIASVQDVIDEIHAKLDAGTPWSELVEEYSTDPGMKQEPNKTDGYSVFSDSMMYDPAFVQAAFSIDNIGDVSEPYVGIYGIYIVHYTRDVPSGPVPLTDELRAELEDELLSDVRSETIEAAFRAWEESADITYTEAGEAYRPVITEDVDEAEAIE